MRLILAVFLVFFSVGNVAAEELWQLTVETAVSTGDIQSAFGGEVISVCDGAIGNNVETVKAECVSRLPDVGSWVSGTTMYRLLNPYFEGNTLYYSSERWVLNATDWSSWNRVQAGTVSFAIYSGPDPDPNEGCTAAGLSSASGWYETEVTSDSRSCRQTLAGDWCEYRPTMISHMMGMWVTAEENTGLACSGASGPQPVDVADPPAPGQLGPCIVGASATVCIDQSVGMNCGTYNGEPYCADSPPDGECVFIPGGSFICNGSIAVEDQPVNPTTQQPAHQEHWQQTTVENNNSVTNNYFGGSGVAPNKNPPGSGNTGSDPGGGSGGGECEPGQVCSDVGAYPSLGDVPGFAEAAGKFFNDIQREGLLAEVKRIGQQMPGGVCPAPSVDVFGTAYNIDWHCQIYPDVSDVLRWVMLAAWSLLAVLILMSA